VNPLLAFKAEIVLAIQLITRHRAPRLAAVLAFSAVALLVAEGRAVAAGEARRHTIIFIAGAVSAVAASRLLAKGPAWASVRRSASHPLVVPAGRLTGFLLLALPAAGAAALSLLALRDEQAPRLVVSLPLYCLAIGAVVMSVTPVLGASAAACAGVALAFLGVAPQ
jgi:hypothetical protein